MPQKDDLNVSAIAVVGVISSVLVLATVLAVQTLYFNSQADLERRRPADGSAAANLAAEQESRLRQQGWIDRQTGAVAIPIDRAMDVVVDELRQQQQE